MNNFVIEENKNSYSAKIKVIGVGGGGCNMINHIIREGIDTQDMMKTVDLIIANTDAQALDGSPATTKIQLGEKKTKGLGAGMRPEVGKESAEESYEEIKTTLEYADIVFVASGLGGGTGTGAAPVVARAAKEVGALTIAIVTTPFSFEGKKRMLLATEGIKELKKECDGVVIIPNQKLIGIIDRKAGVKESFKIVDAILANSVTGMSSIVLSLGNSDVNLDFADVKTAMSHRGLALIGCGVAKGEGAAQEALKNAIQSPLLSDIDFKGSKGVIVHFCMHPNCPMMDIDEAMNIINDTVDEYADIFLGTLTDSSLDEDVVKVTFLATGFDHDESDRQEVRKEMSTKVDNSLIPSLSLKKTSGSDLFMMDSEYLDKPSYDRHRLD